MAKGWRGYNDTQTNGMVDTEVPGRLLGGLSPSQKEVGFPGIPVGTCPALEYLRKSEGP